MKKIGVVEFNRANPPPGGIWDIAMPEGANIASFQMRGNFPTMWYEAEVGLKTYDLRQFKLAMNDEELPSNSRYWGTVQPCRCVVHLIELL